MALACVLEMSSVSGLLLSGNVILDVIVLCYVGSYFDIDPPKMGVVKIVPVVLGRCIDVSPLKPRPCLANALI